MSIINEALKKAEQEKNKLAAVITRPQVKLIKKSRPWGRIILGLGSIIGLAYIINPNIFFSKAPAQAQTKAKTEADPVFVPLAREQERTTASESKTTTLPDFRLNGIVYGEGEPWAMVDDRLLKQGDIIKGAQLIKIEKDRITLAFEGKELTLLLEH